MGVRAAPRRAPRTSNAIALHSREGREWARGEGHTRTSRASSLAVHAALPAGADWEESDAKYNYGGEQVDTGWQFSPAKVSSQPPVT